MENTKTLQTLQNGNIDNQKSVTTEGTGTVLKELNLEAITSIISPAVKTSGWKQFNTGESSEIDFNKRFDLYIRRRNLSKLMMQNDDILKKSSNEVIQQTGPKLVKSMVSRLFRTRCQIPLWETQRKI